MAEGKKIIHIGATDDSEEFAGKQGDDHVNSQEALSESLGTGGYGLVVDHGSTVWGDPSSPTHPETFYADGEDVRAKTRQIAEQYHVDYATAPRRTNS